MSKDSVKEANLNNDKKTVLVVFGGCSSEYEVSLKSSSAVIDAIDRETYDVITMGITREGEWYLYEGDAARIKEDTWRQGKVSRACLQPDRSVHGIAVWREKGIELCYIDVVFPVLHGKNGEDGTLQGLCELAGIPCVGPDMTGSALCMNKELAHTLVKAAGIRVPASVLLKKTDTMDEVSGKTAKLTYPVFVKPVRAGSSFGITKVNSPVYLKSAIELALSLIHI